MKIKRKLSPSAADLSVLNEHFRHYVQSQFPGLAPESEDQQFLFSAFEKSRFIGGICGSVYWNGLEIEVLWVDEKHRRQGIARRLLAESENYAREHSAVIAFLKTVDARDFYEEQGYRVYGQLEDRPIGSILYHMKKRLDRE